MNEKGAELRFRAFLHGGPSVWASLCLLRFPGRFSRRMPPCYSVEKVKHFPLEAPFLPVKGERAVPSFSVGPSAALVESGRGYKIHREPQGWIQRKVPPPLRSPPPLLPASSHNGGHTRQGYMLSRKARRSRSICSSVAPKSRMRYSVMATATSRSPEKTADAPSCFRFSATLR